MGAKNSARGLGYAAGDIIGRSIYPGWSGPEMMIVSLGSGTVVTWQTGGGHNPLLPVGTVLLPVPPNGWIYKLGPDGYLTYSPDPGTSQPHLPITPPPAPDIPPPGGVQMDDQPQPTPWPLPTESIAPGGGNGPPGDTGGIPMWAWLVGGGVLLYFLTRR